MSGRLTTSILAFTAACALAGCKGGGGGGGGYTPSYRPSSTVSSDITSGTREFTGTEYYEQWDVDIRFSVDASGEAFGFYESSSLHLWGDEQFAKDTDSWFNFNSDGWPDGYDVTAEYIPGYGTTGTVRVIVKVDDYMYPNSYDTVYSCDHEITWE
ncbi:hypothetical protein OAG01_00310 [bacterium]|nr:hypothetical protein [bacterium]MDA7668661.1 hypothetical protein [bacterium]MDB4632868.1 hypothetical protein [bacterium]